MIPNLATRLPQFLMQQRWYGEKTAQIEAVEIVDSGYSGNICQLILAITTSTRGRQQYYVPLLHEGGEAFVDAVRGPAYHQWLSAISLSGGRDRLEHGWLQWNRAPGGHDRVIAGSSRLGSAEQSNSSIRFGDAALVKVIRRLQSGVNPEVEISCFLTEHTDFSHAPALIGSLEYARPTGETVVLAVAQSFVPSISDGWESTLATLRQIREAEPANLYALTTQSLKEIGTLGERTAELHLALASDHASPAMAPEPITAADVDAWKTGLAALLHRVSESLDRSTLIDERADDLKRAFKASNARLLDRSAGFERLVNVAKTRVHGDFHLGQTLITHDRDWFILDFEGEPSRSLLERRAKVSPLKDVAGMLRSFSYARGTVEQSVGNVTDVARLVDWERQARRAFLERYLVKARAGNGAFLPRSNEDFRLALDAWELDKAIYEIDYELNNRPSWLWLPLSGALKMI